MNSIDNRLFKLQTKLEQEPKTKYKRPSRVQIFLMKDDQVGRCAICEEILSQDTKHIHVDHCHKTNKVRGLLCANCNKGLGFFKDNTRALERAILYLQGKLIFL